MGASDTRTGPSDPHHAAQTVQGLGFWLLGCSFPLRPDPSLPVHSDSDRSSLSHTHLPSFSFLSLCPNSVADEGIRRPCTVLSHCPRPRRRNFQCLSRGWSTTPNRNPNRPVAVIRKPSPIDDPRPGQGPGCSSSQELESHRSAAARHDGSHEPQQPQPNPASPPCNPEIAVPVLQKSRDSPQSEADTIGSSTLFWSPNLSAANTPTPEPACLPARLSVRLVRLRLYASLFLAAPPARSL